MGPVPNCAIRTEFVKIDGVQKAVKINDFLKNRADFFMEQCEQQRIMLKLHQKTEEENNTPTMIYRLINYLFGGSKNAV